MDTHFLGIPEAHDPFQHFRLVFGRVNSAPDG